MIYEEMNDREKAFVDAVAGLELEHTDDKYALEDIRDVMERKGVKPYNKNYASTKRIQLEEVIEERKQVMANTDSSRQTIERGNVKVTGAVDLSDEQWIKDRVYKGKDMEEREEQQYMIATILDPETVFQVVRTSDEEVARDIFMEVIERGR